MPIADRQRIEWAHAYRVIGVLHDASASSIKVAYRRLVKRWHPDLYKIGSPQHVDASRMSALINDAYAVIKHAPLRYYERRIASTAPRGNTYSAMTTDTQATPASVPVKPINVDRIEFWVHFVSGVLLGVFVLLDLFVTAMPDSIQHPILSAAGALIFVGAFGFASARFGDKLWYSLFGGRWQ